MPTETIIGKVKAKKKFDGMNYDKSFYHSMAWRRVATLHKKINPMCNVKGCKNLVHTTDHIIPIRQGGDKLNFDNLQSLCRFHNASKTSKQQHNKEGGYLCK